VDAEKDYWMRSVIESSPTAKNGAPKRNTKRKAKKTGPFS
jgi:hypothetical protein